MVLLIGVGNGYRRDDGLGIAVARRLEAHHLPDLRVIEHSGEGASLMDVWSQAQSVILVDAVCSGSPSGRIFRLDAHTQPIPAAFFHYSTHAFGVAEAIELARALDQLPPKLILYGVEGEDFSAGEGLSTPVQAAIPSVIESIIADLKAI